ncbi:Rieske 2Fe-2S domain-containing protein [Pararhodobacter zhoushanensis]|uniref:Rieske 2Fe-2S domain-containing protein n=1 Tax=Pararhodobacter zhoushanensis TaxID=2479545 RepID=UPI000F8F0859
MVTGVPLTTLADLPDGDSRGFEVEGWRAKVIIVRKGARVFGWRDLCPHYAGGTSMAWRRDAYLNGARTHLACHAHGAWFDIETGVCVQGACLGKRLTRVPLRIDEEGGVHLDRAPREDKA